MSTEKYLIMEKSKKILLLDIDDTLFNTAKLKRSDLKHFELYDDVIDALEELKDICMLGILSQGELAFQKEKLQRTNIENYFHKEHTYIVERKVEAFKELLAQYEGTGTVFFVEDRLATLRVAKKTHPSTVAIWMKRGRYANTQSQIADFTPDETVTNLKDLVEIIKNF